MICLVLLSHKPCPLRVYNAVGLLKLHGPGEGEKESEAEKQSLKVSGITFASAKRHAVYAGHFPTYMPTMTYQHEGNRLVAFIDLEDLLQVFAAETGLDAHTVAHEDVPKLFQDWLVWPLPCRHHMLFDMDAKSNMMLYSLSFSRSGMFANIHMFVCRSFLRQDVIAFFQEFDAELYEKRSPQTLRWGYIIPHDVVWVPFGTIMVEKATGTCNNVTVRVPCPLFEDDQLGMSHFYQSAYPQILGAVFQKLVFLANKAASGQR